MAITDARISQMIQCSNEYLLCYINVILTSNFIYIISKYIPNVHTLTDVLTYNEQSIDMIDVFEQLAHTLKIFIMLE